MPLKPSGKILVTGSAGHLGEALVRTLRDAAREVVSLDIVASPFTDVVASVTDRQTVCRCMKGADTVLHAASLHKPHLATHSRQAFIDVNIGGTLVLLEEAAAAGVSAFVYTSTTSAFGHALQPPPGAPAAWITEEQADIPKNMYGVTKTAAEGLCEMFHREHGMSCVVLRTSRFFPEEDDSKAISDGYHNDNAKANEYLYRRVDLEDVVSAHRLAMEKAPAIGFGRYIVSATTPFTPEDLADLREGAERVLERRIPEYAAEYRRRGWKMFPGIDRVYVNARARKDLGWSPRYDFRHILYSLEAGEDPRSPISRAVGSKGYHDRRFAAAPYPVERAGEELTHDDP